MSEKFESLQEEKPDRDCYEWENGMLTESITASIEEKTPLTPNLGKKFDQAVPFVCFSAETGLHTMKEVKGASIVEDTSIKPARNIFSTLFKEYAEYQDHNFPNETSEAKSETNSLKSEQPAYCTQKTVKKMAPAVNIPGKVGSKNRKYRKIVLNRAN